MKKEMLGKKKLEKMYTNTIGEPPGITYNAVVVDGVMLFDLLLAKFKLHYHTNVPFKMMRVAP